VLESERQVKSARNLRMQAAGAEDIRGCMLPSGRIAWASKGYRVFLPTSSCRLSAYMPRTSETTLRPYTHVIPMIDPGTKAHPRHRPSGLIRNHASDAHRGGAVDATW